MRKIFSVYEVILLVMLRRIREKSSLCMKLLKLVMNVAYPRYSEVCHHFRLQRKVTAVFAFSQSAHFPLFQLGVASQFRSSYILAICCPALYYSFHAWSLTNVDWVVNFASHSSYALLRRVCYCVCVWPIEQFSAEGQRLSESHQIPVHPRRHVLLVTQY
jgi:hypothetical protein